MRLCAGTMELTEKLEADRREEWEEDGKEKKRGGEMGMQKKLYPT